jgi:ribose transport system substrate-binding protein
VLSRVYCHSDENLAEQLTEKLAEAYPDMDAIVCLNAYGTVGTARAIERLGLAGKIKIIGFDSTSEEVGFVEKDVVQALIIQNPFSMGYLGVKYAVGALNDEVVPKNINTGSKVIDKDNMYQPENQKLVFPFTD